MGEGVGAAVGAGVLFFSRRRRRCGAAAFLFFGEGVGAAVCAAGVSFFSRRRRRCGAADLFFVAFLPRRRRRAVTTVRGLGVDDAVGAAVGDGVGAAVGAGVIVFSRRRRRTFFAFLFFVPFSRRRRRRAFFDVFDFTSFVSRRRCFFDFFDFNIFVSRRRCFFDFFDFTSFVPRRRDWASTSCSGFASAAASASSSFVARPGVACAIFAIFAGCIRVLELHQFTFTSSAKALCLSTSVCTLHFQSRQEARGTGHW